MRLATPALLWARASDSQPGTLSRRAGEETRRDGGINAAGAMAAGRTVARVFGSDLEKARTTPWQERWNQRDDLASARRPERWMGSADRRSARSVAAGGHGCCRRGAHSANAGCGGTPTFCNRVIRGAGGVRAATTGDGRV